MRVKLILIKNEITNFIKNPSIVVILILPVIMSKLVTSAMKSTSLDLFLISMWIIFAQLMIGIMLSAPNIMEERESKTIDALKCTPLTMNDIVISKVIAILILSILSQIFVYIINIGLVYQILYILPIMIIGGLLFILIGVVIGLTSKNSQNVSAISSAVMIILFLIVSVYDIFPKFAKYVLELIPSVSEAIVINSIIDKNILQVKESLILFLWIIIFVFIIKYIVIKSKES